MQKDTDRNSIQDKLKDLFKLVHQCQEERNNSERCLCEVTKAQKQVKKESKLSVSFKTKLCSLYNEAIKSADTEAEVLRKALSIIHEIRSIQNDRRLLSKKAGHPKEILTTSIKISMFEQSGQTLPLWVGQPNEMPPPLCGAMPAEPNYIAEIDEMAVALLGDPRKEKCFLVEVTFFDASTNKYEIKDIDGEKGEKVYIVERDLVIPLPRMRANPETHPEGLFQKGTLILALFPRSTCFYPGFVEQSPIKPTDGYKIIFEDSTCDSGYSLPYEIHQRYVINYRTIDLRKWMTGSGMRRHQEQ